MVTTTRGKFIDNSYYYQAEILKISPYGTLLKTFAMPPNFSPSTILYLGSSTYILGGELVNDSNYQFKYYTKLLKTDASFNILATRIIDSNTTYSNEGIKLILNDRKLYTLHNKWGLLDNIL